MGVENTSNKLVPVYDIVGCGPRKRFVANGKLIHNSEKINLENMPRGSVFRQALIPPPGYVIAACDSANIEARVLPWLAGQEDLLEQFRMQDTGEGLDVYSAMATRIYGRPVDRKRNPDDFIPGFLGKSVVLGCIAEGEMVLTDRGLKPIDKITLSDRLWDGGSWVSHDGLIYKGYKDVITYSGVTATPDHIVFLQDGTTCRLQEAAEKGSRIAITGNGGEEIRFLGDSESGFDPGERKDSGGCPMQRIPDWRSTCRKAHVFDILNSGPNHRFTVSGKLVHNCGFGLGWAKFQAMMRAGMLGQKGITFDQSFVDSMGVDLKKFMADKWCMRRAEEIFKPWDTMDTHIMHCSVAKAIIDTYRGSVPYVVELWGYLNDVILPAMANGDEIIFGPNDILRTGKDCLHTPSGFSLKYNGLHQREDEKGKRQWVYFGRNKKPVYTYGGALAENIVQHLARYIVTYQLILIGRRYKVATMTHDEVVALIPESEAEEGTAWMEDQMRKTKPWMAGIPINAEANWGQTYKDCK